MIAISPVPPTLALRFGGGFPFKRRALLVQTRGHAIALLWDSEPLCLCMFDVSRSRRAELGLSFTPAAGAHVRPMIRFAQLTLPRLAQTGVLVWTRIRSRQGERLAAATGFRPGGFRDPAIWIWKARS